MLDFYQSEEFRKHRKAILQAMVDFVRPRMNDGNIRNYWQAQGAMDLAKKIMEIPGEQIQGDAGEALRRYGKEDMVAFFSDLIKSHMEV